VRGKLHRIFPKSEAMASICLTVAWLLIFRSVAQSGGLLRTGAALCGACVWGGPHRSCCLIAIPPAL